MSASHARTSKAVPDFEILTAAGTSSTSNAGAGRPRVLQIGLSLTVELKLGTAQDFERIVKALQPLAPERIYLFGSWARGEADELSDLDLVVVADTALPFFDRLKAAAALLPDEAGAADVFVYTPDEFDSMQRNGNAFAELVIEEGRLIYARHTEQ
jgi:predicted nucleotidyltransferase